MKKIFLTLGFIFICSCGKKSGLLSGITDTKKDSFHETEAENIQVSDRLVPQNGLPNRYTYEITWNGSENYSQLQYFRSQEGYPLERIENKTQANLLQNEDLKGGEVWNYRIVGVFKSEKYLLFEKKISVPKDLEVKSEMLLTESFKSPNGRLFLGPNSILKTQGLAIKIDVHQIFSDSGAAIDTLPLLGPGVQASGQSGGVLYIKANALDGNLRIISRGVQGANGQPGQAGTKGRNGANGRDAIHLCVNQPNESATNGESGEIGASGAMGSSGYKGGDTAKVRVEIAAAGNGKIEIENLPGLGGLGGSGGPGGEGGEGGKGGQGYGSSCPKGVDGNKGPSGPQGPQGANGLNGQLQPFCVIQEAKIVQGDCDQRYKSTFENL